MLASHLLAYSTGTLHPSMQDNGEKEATLRGLEATLRMQQADVDQKLRDLAEQRDRAAADRKVGARLLADPCTY